jgi:hypothetical protein
MAFAFRVLGPNEVDHGGRAVLVPAGKPWSLLVALLLTEADWPDGLAARCARL